MASNRPRPVWRAHYRPVSASDTARSLSAASSGLIVLTNRPVLQGDTMLRMVYDNLMASIAVNRLLQTENQVAAGLVVSEYRVQVLDDADLPVLLGRVSCKSGRCELFVAAAERAAFDMRARVARGGIFRLAGAHGASRRDQHGLVRYNGIHADFAQGFGTIHRLTPPGADLRIRWPRPGGERLL